MNKKTKKINLPFWQHIYPSILLNTKKNFLPINCQCLDSISHTVNCQLVILPDWPDFDILTYWPLMQLSLVIFLSSVSCLLELEYGCGWDACAAISGPPTNLTNRCVVIWNSCSASITSLHQLLHFINLHYILAKATICLKWGANQTERSGDTELHSRLCVRTRLTFFEPERCVQWRCRVWRRVKMRWRRDVNSMRHRIKCMH